MEGGGDHDQEVGRRPRCLLMASPGEAVLTCSGTIPPSGAPAGRRRASEGPRPLARASASAAARLRAAWPGPPGHGRRRNPSPAAGAASTYWATARAIPGPVGALLGGWTPPAASLRPFRAARDYVGGATVTSLGMGLSGLPTTGTRSAGRRGKGSAAMGTGGQPPRPAL